MDEGAKTQLTKFYKEQKKVITYSGKEVRELTGISLRTFRYRIEELKRFKGIENYLEKRKNQWVIHQDLIHHFFHKTKRKEATNVYQIDWKTFITWAPGTDYPKEYHSHIIRQVINKFPNGLFLPVIEETDKGVNHVHMICDVDDVIMEKKIKEILEDYWHWWDYRLEVEPIQDVVLAVNYITKDQLAAKSVMKNEELITKILKQYENEKF